MADLLKLLALNPAALATALALIALLIAVVFVVGFRQGREISFWPPKIGPDPRKVVAPLSQPVVPRPASEDVSEVPHLHPPDYGPFEFVKDIRVVDLRTRVPIPEDKRGEPVSPVTWVRYTLVRKSRPVDRISFQFATTGVQLDPRCLTHPYALKKAVEADVHGQRNLAENWEVDVDVSEVPVGEEFLVINEVTYWNAFRGEEGDWASVKAEKDTREIALLLLFPPGKPYGTCRLYAYPHGSAQREEFAGDSRIIPSKSHLSFFWKIENPKKEYAYEVEWTW